MLHLPDLAIAELSRLIRSREISPLEITRACLERISRANRDLNAFITVMEANAIAQGKAAEREIHDGHWRGPLHGIPIALKDIIDTEGVHTTAASALFEGRVPTRDAELVRRLRQAGAVLIGKTNLHEFAYGGSGIISRFGPVHNPLQPAYITGGSSSGSAAAVSAGMCCAAIGTDTAGSIRLPASYCGLTGLKPSLGLVSTRGVIPLAWSYDHAGPIARTAEDAAILLDVLAGFDPEDPESKRYAPVRYQESLTSELPRLRLGIVAHPFFDDLDQEIRSSVEDAIRVLSGICAETEERVLELDDDRTVSNSEAFAFHAESVRSNPELYDPETLRRIRTGEHIPAALYIQKRRALETLRRRLVESLAEGDVFASATVPIPPPLLTALERDRQGLRGIELLMLRNTRPFNVSGMPAITVPCGSTAKGLPIGLQIAARAGSDHIVLQLAHRYQKQLEKQERG